MYKLTSMQLCPTVNAVNVAPETQFELVSVCCSSGLNTEAWEKPRSLIDCDL